MDKIERNINKIISSTLEAANFQLNKEFGYFVRKTSYGHDAFVVINQGRVDGDKFGIGCAIEVRHDIIENPWNSLGFIYGENEKLETSTLTMAYPSVRFGSKSDMWKLTPATLKENIEMVAMEIAQAFTKHAVPFYNQFSHLEEVEKMLNKVPMADISPYTGGLPVEHRAMRSLLCAKAVNPERYSVVRDTFVKMNKGMFPFEKRMEMLEKVDAMKL